MSAVLFGGRKGVVIWVSLADGEVGGVKKEAGSLYPGLPSGCRPLAQRRPAWPMCRGVPPLLRRLKPAALLLSLGQGEVVPCTRPVLGLRFLPADAAAPRGPTIVPLRVPEKTSCALPPGSGNVIVVPLFSSPASPQKQLL